MAPLLWFGRGAACCAGLPTPPAAVGVLGFDGGTGRTAPAAGVELLLVVETVPAALVEAAVVVRALVTRPLAGFEDGRDDYREGVSWCHDSERCKEATYRLSGCQCGGIRGNFRILLLLFSG